MKSQDELLIEILMKEYATLREEILFHFKEAKLPAKYLQIFIAGSAVVGYYLLFHVDAGTLSTGLGINVTTRGLFIWFLFAMNFVSYYFVFDILDSYFCIFLAAARIINIEEQINNRLGMPLLVWESKFQLEDAVRFGTSRATITRIQITIIFLVSFALPVALYVWLWFSSTCAQKILQVITTTICAAMFGWFIYASYRVLFPERIGAIDLMRRLSPVPVSPVPAKNSNLE